MTLNSPVYGENPGFIFTDASGNRVYVEDIQLDPTNSSITALTDLDGNPVDPRTVEYQKYALYIPGIGNILPGAYVIWKEQEYVLQFGWHINVSNQELYTWYLLPLEGTNLTPKTLYRWMIREIEVVHFR